jgi:branched-chain amino acid transport system permease protein
MPPRLAAPRTGGVLALAAFIAVLPLALSNNYYYDVAILVGVNAIVCVGLNLLIGYAGQISLGHAGFFGLGAYGSAVLTARYGWPPLAALVAATAGVAVLAFAIGRPILRLKGHYLAMATLGFGTIIYSIVLGTQRFGAADGISGVPPFPLLPGAGVSGSSSLRVLNYYMAWAFVTAAMVLLTNLIHSRVGRALRSIHGAEDAANAMGVDTARYKLYTFMLSAVLAAVAGVFLTHYNGGIGPSEAGIMKSVRYVAIVAVGGMGSLWGTLIMSVVLNFLSLRGYFGSFDDAVFGGILILIMLFAPDGIIGADLRKLFGIEKNTKSQIPNPK